MYASIDLVSHKLAQKLKRQKDKVQEKRQNQKIGGSVTEEEEDLGLAFNDEELLVDLDAKYRDLAKEAASVPIDISAIRQKVFKMPPISVEEAITSLDFIDHPFFVFRNKVPFSRANFIINIALHI
jgi:putative sigma-54 modulation protein